MRADKFGYLSRCVHKHKHTRQHISLKKIRHQKMASNRGHERTETGNQTDAHEHARGARVTPASSEGTEGPVCAALGSRPHEAQSGRGEGETEVESEAKRGGADGSAIWWMEEKQGR